MPRSRHPPAPRTLEELFERPFVTLTVLKTFVPISAPRLRRWVRSGRLPVVRHAGERDWQVDIEALRRSDSALLKFLLERPILDPKAHRQAVLRADAQRAREEAWAREKRRREAERAAEKRAREEARTEKKRRREEALLAKAKEQEKARLHRDLAQASRRDHWPASSGATLTPKTLEELLSHRWIRLSTFARFVPYSTRTLARWARRGRLPASRLRDEHDWWICLRALRAKGGDIMNIFNEDEDEDVRDEAA